jgi:hypothetical protein
MLSSAVYFLCAVTSGGCAALLLREHARSATSLLLWSSLAFIGFTIANALVFADFVLLPANDLSIARSTVSAISIMLLLIGLIWTGD